MPRLAMLLFLSALPFGLLRAQAATMAPAGSQVRVRIMGNDGWTKGTVRSVDDGTLVLVTDENTEMRLPTRSVTAMDVSRGRKSRWKGAAVGFLIGGGAGGVLGYVTGKCPDPEPGTFIGPICVFSPGESAALLGGLGGLAGAGIGALVHGGEKWKRAPVPARLTIAPVGGGGWRVGVSF